MSDSAFIRALLSAVVCCALAVWAAPAGAQEEEEADRPADLEGVDAAREERILVTGTRILRDTNLDSVAPVQTIDRDSITFSGSFNMADVLRQNPALFSSTTSEINVQGGSGLAGRNTLNMRGLGGSRALTLVDGRRHVAGVEGTQAVEIGSIPLALVERVEVLTGGASALYGADAVSGVVNFITRRDFEGYQMDVRGGLSGEGDADQYTLSAVYGRNFANRRGNVAVAVDYFHDPGLRVGDRAFAADNRIARNQSNPDLRFQSGDITANNTPNFFNFYNFDNTGRFHYGLLIPSSAESFAAQYEAEFGEAPELTAAELALIQRASEAPPRAILPFPTFSITSKHGLIAPVDFGLTGLDTTGSGTDDCLESFVGWNSTIIGTGSFGLAGGCWIPLSDGSVRLYQDGLVVSSFNQFGGDGIEDRFNENFLIPRENRVSVNLLSSYDLTPQMRVFMDAKFVHASVEAGGPLNTFWDLLYGSPENPFLPAQLRDLAENTAGFFGHDQDGGLYITRDNIDIGAGINRNERQTVRVVTGLEGVFANGFQYELSANYGRFDRKFLNRDMLIQDRWFAAIDVIEDPDTGQPICRSDIDPTPPVTTLFNIPSWNESGYYTFTPGDGQCKPANIWGGIGSISQESIDFFMVRGVNRDTITQSVVTATLVGDTAGFWMMPDGPVDFAVGAEYRRETSEARFNPWDRGIIPDGAPFPAGTLVSDVSANESLGFDGGNIRLLDARGSFHVYEAFGEVSVPLLSHRPLVHDLRLDAAFRVSDYSTVGNANVIQGGLMWSPIEDFRLRGAWSRAVRAPNISELFSPEQSTTFRPIDPCDHREITALAEADPDRAQIRASNCQAEGLPADFEDPLSARFTGVIGGNPALSEETADTITFGILLQPRFAPGLTVSVDYWDISIDDGISPVSAQDTVNSCYDSPTFPNDFCALFTRVDDPASPQFQGFNFLRQTQVNFAAIEASGIDLTARYNASIGAHRVHLNMQVTRQDKLDFFFDPLDDTAVTKRLGELLRPKWAGNAILGWEYGQVNVQYQGRYVGKQTLRGVEVDTVDTIFGPAGFTDSVTLHDIRAQYQMRPDLMIFGGIDNFTDEQPYITEFSAPSGARGRFFFTGLSYRF